VDKRSAALSVLGLQQDPGPERLRTTFLNLARRWHPDRHPNAGDKTRAALCRRFSAIARAYEELTVES
jgi:curved DNA-binding protein CbpA